MVRMTARTLELVSVGENLILNLFPNVLFRMNVAGVYKIFVLLFVCGGGGKLIRVEVFILQKQGTSSKKILHFFLLARRGRSPPTLWCVSYAYRKLYDNNIFHISIGQNISSYSSPHQRVYLSPLQ